MTADTSPEALARWITEQRWFDRSGPADHAEGASPGVTLSEAAPLPGHPSSAIQIAETVGGQRYQLLVSTTPTTPTAPAAPAAPGGIDRAADPEVATALVELAVQRTSSDTGLGTITGHWMDDEPPPGDTAARALGAEQTNTSIVIGGTHVLKVFRQLGLGVNPEVEIGRHLHEVETGPGTRTAPVADLCGWYELVDGDGVATTLGVVNRFVPAALDGWSLALSALAAHPPDLLPRLRDLGAAVARLHDALAQPAEVAHPGADNFGATPLDPGRVDQLADATVSSLTAITPAAGAATTASVGDRIGVLASAVDRTDLGPAIRTHGDLHLGQTVVGPDGWVIFDFEGEPTRSMEERRLHHSPLRDVAGLLRSLSYAVETVRRSGAQVSAGWEPAARAAVLDGYLATVDPALLPRSTTSVRRLLTLFEVEKAVYEVAYELSHRPDWVHVPLSALERFQ